MTTPSYAILDEALDRLAGFDCATTNGNFNHAPMVAEALCALGQPEAVLPWIERYAERLQPRGPCGDPIQADRWQEALGQRERFVAWEGFFADALAKEGWRDVLAQWAARLAPGLSGAATHGVIRTGHAVRGLSAGETPQRRRELADALASWATSYAELPAAAAATGNAAAWPPCEAIRQVAVVPPERRRRGNIAAGLAGLSDFPEFAPVIGLANLGGNIGNRLVELCELFARVSLANIRNVATAICFIHGVTSTAALGHIAPHVDEATARTLLRYGWQAGCGLYAAFGGHTPLAEEPTAPGEAIDMLIDQAIANGDEHAIKFAEACASRHRLAPSPAYPAALGHVLAVIPGR